MTESLRVRAAVVVASLVGCDDEVTWARLPEADRLAAEHVRARLRAPGDRARIARAVVAERFALFHARAATSDPALGAQLLARWMRGLEPGARAQVARGLREDDVAAVRTASSTARPFDDAHRDAAAWMMAAGARALGRVPTVGECAGLARWLRDGVESSSPAVLRWERALRVAGRRAACRGAARALEVT